MATTLASVYDSPLRDSYHFSPAPPDVSSQIVGTRILALPSSLACAHMADPFHLSQPSRFVPFTFPTPKQPHFPVPPNQFFVSTCFFRSFCLFSLTRNKVPFTSPLKMCPADWSQSPHLPPDSVFRDLRQPTPQESLSHAFTFSFLLVRRQFESFRQNIPSLLPALPRPLLPCLILCPIFQSAFSPSIFSLFVVGACGALRPIILFFFRHYRFLEVIVCFLCLRRFSSREFFSHLHSSRIFAFFSFLISLSCFL